jgi:hypothetical protein
VRVPVNDPCRLAGPRHHILGYVGHDNVLGAAVGTAGDDGKQTTTLTVPVTVKTGTVKISTVRLSSAPPTDEKPADTCKSKREWEGQPTQSSIAIKSP